MAQHLSNLNLVGNQIQQFVVEPLAVAPSAAVKLGRKYYNSAENREAIYDGEAWKFTAYMTDIAGVSTSLGRVDTRLQTIEAFFATEEQSDNVINKWNEIVSFLAGVSDTTLNGILAGYTVKSREVKGDGTTITGGGDLSADRILSLADSGVTAGTYTKITVDKYGRATNGETLSSTDIPELAISKIADLQTELDNRYTKTELKDYIDWLDRVKGLIDKDGSNIKIKTNLIVEGDTVTTRQGSDSGTTGTFVAIKIGETTYGDLYIESGVLNLTEAFTPYYTSEQVDEKIAAADISGKLTEYMKFTDFTKDNIKSTLGISDWALAANAPTKTDLGLGNVENTKLSIWTGTNKITTLGTITTGVWNGTAIANNYLVNSKITIAGTDVSLGGSITAATLATSLVGAGMTKKYATAISKVDDKTSYKLTHSLNTRDVVVMVYDPTTYEQVMVDVIMTDANNVTIDFATTPSKNYKVVVVG